VPRREVRKHLEHKYQIAKGLHPRKTENAETLDFRNFFLKSEFKQDEHTKVEGNNYAAALIKPNYQIEQYNHLFKRELQKK